MSEPYSPLPEVTEAERAEHEAHKAKHLPRCICGKPSDECKATCGQGGSMREALQVLYDETADYIRINHLGDVHHNRSMQMARDALAAPQGVGKLRESMEQAESEIAQLEKNTRPTQALLREGVGKLSPEPGLTCKHCGQLIKFFENIGGVDRYFHFRTTAGSFYCDRTRGDTQTAEPVTPLPMEGGPRDLPAKELNSNPKGGVEGVGQTARELNREHHLYSGDEESASFGKYARDGESVTTGNVGAWYSSACYWRTRAEVAESKLPESAAKDMFNITQYVLESQMWRARAEKSESETLTLRAELQQAHKLLGLRIGRIGYLLACIKEFDERTYQHLANKLTPEEIGFSQLPQIVAELRSRLQEAEKVLWHQVVRSHEYAPDGCSVCEQAEQMLKEDSNAPRS